MLAEIIGQPCKHGQGVGCESCQNDALRQQNATLQEEIKHLQDDQRRLYEERIKVKDLQAENVRKDVVLGRVMAIIGEEYLHTRTCALEGMPAKYQEDDEDKCSCWVRQLYSPLASEAVQRAEKNAATVSELRRIAESPTDAESDNWRVNWQKELRILLRTLLDGES